MYKSLLGLFGRLFPFLFSSKLRESAYTAKPLSSQQLADLLGKPRYVRVPNGFPIPSRTNGASRRRKTNRLHLSTKTRNKHR